MNTTKAQINLDYLYLMADGDETMVQTMLEMLLQELPEEIQKMRTQYQAKDWDELRQTSHKMKSTLAFIGHEEMTLANRDIETLTKEKTALHRIRPMVEVLESHLTPVLQALEEKLRR